MPPDTNNNQLIEFSDMTDGAFKKAKASQGTDSIERSETLSRPGPTEFPGYDRSEDVRRFRRIQIHHTSAKFKMIKGTQGDYQHLDREYRVRFPGRAFFHEGTVFKILWAEPACNVLPENSSIATEKRTYIHGRSMEEIYCEIRWFVVIRAGRDSCTCL